MFFGPLDEPTVTVPKFSDAGLIFSLTSTGVGVAVGVAAAVGVAVVAVAVAVGVEVAVAMDGAEERRDGSRGGDRKSKAPPCRRKRDKSGAPSGMRCEKGWASPHFLIDL
jgi:hypothetical protein